MKKVEFSGLIEALHFINKHGGAVKTKSAFELPDHIGAMGAYAPASSWVELQDGSIFGVEAFTNGPLSEVTPDEDFGVNLIGWEV